MKAIARALGLTTMVLSGTVLAEDFNPPATDNFGQFKKDGIEVLYFSGDTTDGIFARGYIPSSKLDLGHHFGDFADQVYFWGQGIYGSGKVKYDNIPSSIQPDVDLSHFSIGGGIGIWQPLHESEDGQIKVSGYGNIGLRYASATVKTSTNSHTENTFGIPIDFGILMNHVKVPDLTVGFALLDPGLGEGHDDDRMGPLYASYRFTPNIKAITYLGGTSTIGVEWNF